MKYTAMIIVTIHYRRAAYFSKKCDTPAGLGRYQPKYASGALASTCYRATIAPAQHALNITNIISALVLEYFMISLSSTYIFPAHHYFARYFDRLCRALFDI